MSEEDLTFGREALVAEPEEKPAQPSKTKSSRLEVRVIESRGKAVLVEVHTKKRWSRSVVPTECLVDGKVTEADLDAGDISVAWEEVIHFHATPETLGEAFRGRGIFNREDLAAKLPVAKSAMQDVYLLDIIELLKGDRS